MENTTSGSPPSGAAALATFSIRHCWVLYGKDFHRYRVGVLVRTLVAIAGGYGFSSMCAAAMAIYLPMTPVEAITTATLTAFIVYPGIVIWVFAASTALRATVGLLIPAAAVGALLLVQHAGAGA